MVALSMPSLAEPRAFTFVTDPPGAQIRDQQGRDLGFSGETIHLDPNLYGEVFDINLRMPGFKPKTLVLRKAALEGPDRYPVEGAVALESNSSWVGLRQHPLAMAVGLGVLGAAVWLTGLLLYRDRSRQLKLSVLRDFGQKAKDHGTLLLEILGNYRLVDVLGRGGMATVYRGLPEASLNEREAVAVKVLAANYAQGTDFDKRFRREVQAYRGLSHPSIVQLYDWGHCDQGTYLVMELIRGVLLRDRLATNIPIFEALRILNEIFEAMAYAHDRGIVHRDLKPDNVMLPETGGVKIMDFGLARSEDSEKITRTGTIMGTPAYMAPEQINGGLLDPRTDQYALGVMAFEMLTGQLPFESDDVVQLIFHQVSTPAPDPRQVRPRIPESAAMAILKMLEKKPEERFANLDLAKEFFLRAAKEL